MNHIFVSYARRDKAFVDALAMHLRGAKYTLWLDREREDELAVEIVWQDAVVEAIEVCNAFLLILSKESVQSQESGANSA